MTEKITLANADDQPKKKARTKKPSKAKPRKDSKDTILPETRNDVSIPNAPTVPLTDSEKAQPLHSVVGRYQHEAVKTLVHLMRHAKSEMVRKNSATEVLALGGNDPAMLKLQAVMTGRNKDVSQMSTEELEVFLRNAKDTLERKKDDAAFNATLVNAEEFDPNLNESDMRDALKTVDNEVDTWL